MGSVPEEVHPSPLEQAAQFVTTSRLVPALLNEGFVRGTVSDIPTECSTSRTPGLLLSSPVNNDGGQVWVALTSSGLSNVAQRGMFHHEDFTTPVLIRGVGSGFVPDVDPVAVAEAARVAFDPQDRLDEDGWNQLLDGLANSWQNQVAWLDWAKEAPRPTLESDPIEWEHSLFNGHPVHPMNRSLVAEPPLKQLDPSQAPTLLHPKMAVIAVDRSSLRIHGPFRTTLKPLLDKLDLPPLKPNEIAFPVLQTQLPAIEARFTVRILRFEAFVALAHSPFRTVSPPRELDFRFHIKCALAYKIGSALRTITPWTARVGPEASAMLEDLLPEELWLHKEVASVTGAQKDFDCAKHISCVLREDLHLRAQSLDQVLLPTTALAHRPYGSEVCHAAILFNLQSEEDKLDFIAQYTSKLMDAILPPALESGVCLEAHGQNTMVRIHKPSLTVAGFAFRDLGGIKCYTPRLRQKGYELLSALADSFIITDDLEETWSVLHHTLIQNQMLLLIRRLQVDMSKAWAIVRDEVRRVLKASRALEEAREFEKFFFKPQMWYKAFLRMKCKGIYRDYEYTEVPNVLLT